MLVRRQCNLKPKTPTKAPSPAPTAPAKPFNGEHLACLLKAASPWFCPPANTPAHACQHRKCCLASWSKLNSAL